MRYVSYFRSGRAAVGELRGDALVPLVGIDEIGSTASTEALQEAPRDEAAASHLDEVTLRPVVPAPTKVFGVGLNYRAHVEETQRDVPTYPVLFPKFASSLLPADTTIALPPESSQVDYEGELAVVMGKRGRRIPEADALDYVLGYTVANDVTMRDFQYKTHQWVQGKAWDASTPLGPSLVTPDEVDLGAAGIRTILNGEVVQESDLSRLIFPVHHLVAVISEFTELMPGDVILTGTPGGVGYRRNPQVFLSPGDIVEVEIDGVGRISSPVSRETAVG